MKLSERMNEYAVENAELSNVVLMEFADKVAKLEARLASARAIMEKFVNKVDTGRARSTETYREMKQWMEEE